MIALVLVAVVALSLALAIAAAWTSLQLAMYLIERATSWTAARQATPGWANDAAMQEPATPARQPLAA